MEAIIRRAELAAAPRRIGRAGLAVPQPSPVEVAAPAAPVAPDMASHVADTAAVRRPAAPGATPAPADAGRVQQVAASPAPAASVSAAPDMQALRAEALAAALAQVRQEQQAVLQEQLAQHKQEHQAALASLEAARRELDAACAATLTAAREEGLAQGAAQAQAEARAEVVHALDATRAAVAALDAERAALAASQEDMLVEIVFTAVCRMLGAQAATRAGILAQVRSLLAQQAATTAVAVHLHPADAELLQADGSLGAQVQVVADPAVELGGCLLVGERGTLDARLELQLDALRAALLDVRARRANGGEEE